MAITCFSAIFKPNRSKTIKGSWRKRLLRPFKSKPRSPTIMVTPPPRTSEETCVETPEEVLTKLGFVDDEGMWLKKSKDHSSPTSNLSTEASNCSLEVPRDRQMLETLFRHREPIPPPGKDGRHVKLSDQIRWDESNDRISDAELNPSRSCLERLSDRLQRDEANDRIADAELEPPVRYPERLSDIIRRDEANDRISDAELDRRSS